MPKQHVEAVSIPESKTPLGDTPAKLANREIVKPNEWCPKPDIEFDTWCDPDNPKTVIYKDVAKAASAISQEFGRTPLERSKYCVQFGIELYYKHEIFHRTGSFHERGAFYSLSMLSDDQKRDGVYTASLGNWALALSYHGQKLKIPITIVLPVSVRRSIVEKCQYDFGAKVILHGTNLAEAKKYAFTMIAQNQIGTYINGFDHPNVIAASGSIGIEILEQLPYTDAIILPIGGGALIAGVAAAVKQINPRVLIYGVEPVKCCSFFKAMENERPYQTAVAESMAESLAVPTAGHNAFHTARSLIDKLVLVDDDMIARAVLHLVEEEKLVTEGAGATSFGALLAVPDILPELRSKNVVCVITGGNIDTFILPRCLERAKAIEGRIIKLTVTLAADDTRGRLRVLSIISNVGCNILQSYTDRAWLEENDLDTVYVTFIIETRNLEHSCTLKRVMSRIFPNICEFLEEPFSPIPICACFPKRFP